MSANSNAGKRPVKQPPPLAHSMLPPLVCIECTQKIGESDCVVGWQTECHRHPRLTAHYACYVAAPRRPECDCAEFAQLPQFFINHGDSTNRAPTWKLAATTKTGQQ
jgi:hypothetical protein